MITINNEIDAANVKLVKEDGTGVEIIPTSEALSMAEERGEDLICISNSGDIPVVKIEDYNKYMYNIKRKAKDKQKKQKSCDTKEIVISDVIAEHDLDVKAKHIDKMLNDGDKVLLTIRYKGRAVKFIDEGPDKLYHLAEKVTAPYKIEKKPKINGNTVSMMISAKN